MVEAYNRHHFLNHKSGIRDLLKEIEFIDEDKARAILDNIESEATQFRDFSFFYFDEAHLVGVLFAKVKQDLAEIGKTIEIKFLAVHKDHHQKGIASELMDFLISAVKLNFANIYLTCYEKNEQAIKFYTKFRFVPYRINGIVQTKTFYQDSIDEHVDICFLRRLPLRNVTIRPLRTSNVDFLKEMVFQSLYTEGELFDRAVLEDKSIAKYYVNWDSKREIGFIARYADKDIGAIWCRLFPYYDQGYGYVDDDIPEMGIAVFEQYRNRGLGQLLIDHLIARLKHMDIRAVSLSVNQNNPAKRAYLANGFVAVKREGHSITMLKKLR